jgi:Na+/pantothenate symporter
MHVYKAVRMNENADAAIIIISAFVVLHSVFHLRVTGYHSFAEILNNLETVVLRPVEVDVRMRGRGTLEAR